MFKCLSLAFIPRRNVEDIFATLILDSAPFDTYPALVEFTDNMVETCVDSDALFPKKLWNHFKNPDERVNNNNESFNHWFNTR